MSQQQLPLDEVHLESSCEDAALLARFRELRRRNDPVLREQLVCEQLRLVRSVAQKYAARGESLEDIVQEGTIGLLQAVDRYDPDRGVLFATYARRCIASQIQHYLRDRGSLIRQPGWVQETRTKLLRATETLTQELSRDPSIVELASQVQMSEQVVQEMLALRNLNSVLSLSMPSEYRDDGQNSYLDTECVSQTHADDKPPLTIEDRVAIEEAISALQPREQQVVRMFFFENLNFTEIARKLGISVNYASYIFHRGVSHLKTAISDGQQPKPSAVVPRSAMKPSLSAPPLEIKDHQRDFRRRVEEEIARCERHPSSFAVMFLELREVQSCHTEATRRILLSVEQLLHAGVRKIDVVMSESGTRFALLFPHTGAEAAVLGERLCQMIAARNFRVGPAGLPVTASVGFALYDRTCDSVDALCSKAADALAAAQWLQGTKAMSERPGTRQWRHPVGAPPRMARR